MRKHGVNMRLSCGRCAVLQVQVQVQVQVEKVIVLHSWCRLKPKPLLNIYESQTSWLPSHTTCCMQCNDTLHMSQSRRIT